jgi:branched-chain amino acid transport system ATP-binding protein
MRFGGLVAVDDVGFTAYDREITAVIGPNGAGKTTLFNCLTGFYKPTAGRLTLARGGGTFLLERMPAHLIARRAGVARTFQNIRLFANLSALENVMIGRHVRTRAGVLGAVLRNRATLAEEAAIEERALELLDYVGIAARANDAAGSLPYGDQRRLEIARAMCTDPVLLCLDEPAAGLNPRESSELAELLQDIRDSARIGVLLIEHDMSVVMRISDHVVVLDYGRKIADGPPDAVRDDPAVIKAYLGEDDEDELPPEVAADLGIGTAEGRP